MSVAQLLLVEDDAAIRGALIRALTERGHAVTSMPSAMDALQHVLDSPPDLILLDLGLPGLGGYEALRMMRAVSSVPVVVVTARDNEAEIIRVLDAGADDYVIKPFVAAELVARVRAVLRRAGRLRSTTIEVADVVIDEDAGEVLRGGCRIAVTATELRLIGYLARQRGRVVSKTQILTQVWGYDAYDPNLVEAYVSTLRRKLEQHGPRVIHTVRGVGYRIGETTAGGATG